MLERFYLPEDLKPGPCFLTAAEHHHLSRVLRVREKEEIELVNGKGALAIAKVETIEKERTKLILLSQQISPEPTFRLLSGIPLMRPSKLEWILEKGTEIGADAFFLYQADHSTQETLSSHQIERLRTLTIAALKQSRRLFLPEIEILPNLQALLKTDAEILYGDPRTSTPLSRKQNQTVLFITGPESGFSEAENALLKERANPILLNQNVLRCETAPLVALSILASL